MEGRPVLAGGGAGRPVDGLPVVVGIVEVDGTPALPPTTAREPGPTVSSHPGVRAHRVLPPTNLPCPPIRELDPPYSSALQPDPSHPSAHEPAHPHTRDRGPSYPSVHVLPSKGPGPTGPRPSGATETPVGRTGTVTPDGRARSPRWRGCYGSPLEPPLTPGCPSSTPAIGRDPTKPIPRKPTGTTPPPLPPTWGVETSRTPLGSILGVFSIGKQKPGPTSPASPPGSEKQ